MSCCGGNAVITMFGRSSPPRPGKTRNNPLEAPSSCVEGLSDLFLPLLGGESRAMAQALSKTSKYCLSFTAAGLKPELAAVMARIHAETGNWKETRALVLERNALQTRSPAARPGWATGSISTCWSRCDRCIRCGWTAAHPRMGPLRPGPQPGSTGGTGRPDLLGRERDLRNGRAGL
jgi:hypothetical protein